MELETIIGYLKGINRKAMGIRRDISHLRGCNGFVGMPSADCIDKFIIATEEEIKRLSDIDGVNNA